MAQVRLVDEAAVVGVDAEEDAVLAAVARDRELLQLTLHLLDQLVQLLGPVAREGTRVTDAMTDALTRGGHVTDVT